MLKATWVPCHLGSPCCSLLNVRGQRWIKEKLLCKLEPELEDLENSSSFHTAKKWEIVFWRESNGCGGTTVCYQEIIDVICGFSQPFWQKYRQLGLK